MSLKAYTIEYRKEVKSMNVHEQKAIKKQWLEVMRGLDQLKKEWEALQKIRRELDRYQ